MTDLSALIARVEEGNHADRTLDGEVFIALSPECQAAGRIDHLQGVVGWWPKDGPYESARPVPAFTGSLDSVLSLIEQKLPGWGHCYATGWDAEGNCGGFVSPERTVDLAKATLGVSKSPARALLAATLRALSALENRKADLADATNGDRP